MAFTTPKIHVEIRGIFGSYIFVQKTSVFRHNLYLTGNTAKNSLFYVRKTLSDYELYENYRLQ